jgi:hypothetical protein
MPQDHWLPGFNFNVEELGREGAVGGSPDLDVTNMEAVMPEWEAGISQSPQSFGWMRRSKTAASN